MIQTFMCSGYNKSREEQDEDELADAHTETDSYGQLSIKEDLFGFVGRSLIS
jgi:hypothetical protein